MPSLGWAEILLIVLVIILLFGAPKLPTMARSLGRSMRIFKAEINEMKKDDAGEIDARSQSDAIKDVKADPVDVDDVIIDPGK